MNDPATPDERGTRGRHDRRELWGWILFLLCAVVYLAAAVRDGDVFLAVGSAMFLAACVLFLLAFRRP